MANVRIPQLAPAIGLDGTEELELAVLVSPGEYVSRRATTSQIAGLGGGGGGGDVSGPASATINDIPIFSATTGKVIADSKINMPPVATGSTLAVADGITFNIPGSGSVSGINTGDQIITLTGDVTGTGTGTFAATIAANAVTNAKLAQMPANTFKGNNTAGLANALDLTVAQATAALNAMVGDSGSGGTKGMAPAPAAGDAAASKFLKADGTWAVPSGSGTGTVNSVSVATANGFAGSVADPTNNPIITISTSITGFLLGNGTSVSAVPSTGSSLVVRQITPTLVTPLLGTPTSGVLTNCTGLPIGTGVSGLGAGVATFLGTPSSANLATAVTDETGSGALVFGTSPTLTTPNLGTPSAAILTNATGLPIATGVSGLGVGVAAFLAVPSSNNLAAAMTDETGTGSLVFAISPTLVSPTLGAATGTSLQLSGLTASAAVATDGSKNLVSVTNTGSGNNVLATSPTLVTPALGTPSAAVLTNATGLPLTTGTTGTLPETKGGTNQTAYTTGDVLYASGANTLAKLGVGSTGQVLTVAAGVPSWAAPAGGGLTLIDTIATTSGATQSLTGIPAYQGLVVVWNAVSHNSGSAQTYRIAVSSNNGASYGTPMNVSAPVSGAAVFVHGASYLFMTDLTGTKISTGVVGVSGSALSTVLGTDAAVTGVIDAIQISPSAGSFDSGEVKIFGW